MTEMFDFPPLSAPRLVFESFGTLLVFIAVATHNAVAVSSTNMQRAASVARRLGGGGIQEA